MEYQFKKITLLLGVFKDPWKLLNPISHEFKAVCAADYQVVIKRSTQISDLHSSTTREVFGRVEFLLGQLFHTLIYNEVGLSLKTRLGWWIEKPLTTKPFFILSKSLRETLGHKKNGKGPFIYYVSIYF